MGLLNQDDILSLELEQRKLSSQKLLRTFPWLAAAALIVLAAFYTGERSLVLDGFQLDYLYIAILFLVPLLIGLTINWNAYLGTKKLLADYREMLGQLERAGKQLKMSAIQQTISDVQARAKENHLVSAALELHLPLLDKRVGDLRRAQLKAQLDSELKDFDGNCDMELAIIKNEVPLVKAQANINTSLQFLKRRREEVLLQWQMAYEQFSWWNKLKYGNTPNLTEMDKVIYELENMSKKLLVNHGDDLQHLDAHFEALKDKAISRVAEAKTTAEYFIQEFGHQEGLDSDLLKKSLWLSALSLPVSVWVDANRAGDVFDALRQVNGNFSGMSDAEIWWEALFMSSESLAGLAALAKGAYFEQLVAADTGGVLFEHFNNPGTDIVIDGIAYQLKATSSAGYVSSVEDGIPVIATSEVALSTGVGDSGYSDADLTDTVGLALGGTVVDVGDSIVDSILTGVGGLGIFATIEGINHAAKQHANGGDGVEAIFEGAGVAIEGTARAFVGAAEMGFNILSSRPSRFVGRTLLKGLEKLDEKMMNDSGHK